MYLVISKWVIAVNVSNFSGQYHWTLDIGVLGYIGIVWPKEHSPEVWSVPPVTPCICEFYWGFHTTFLSVKGFWEQMKLVKHWCALWISGMRRALWISGMRQNCNSRGILFQMWPQWVVGFHLKGGLKGEVKGKAIPLQAWTCPEGSRRLRLPDFKTVGTWRW